MHDGEVVAVLDVARLKRFAEDAWHELRKIDEQDVFLYGYLEAEAAALGLEPERATR